MDRIKIAIELKKDSREKVINELIRKDYEIGYSSFYYTIWVYDLGNIRFDNVNKNSIILENGKTMVGIRINFNDIEYFEIHNQKEQMFTLEDK